MDPLQQMQSELGESVLGPPPPLVLVQPEESQSIEADQAHTEQNIIPTVMDADESSGGPLPVADNMAEMELPVALETVLILNDQLGDDVQTGEITVESSCEEPIINAPTEIVEEVIQETIAVVEVLGKIENVDTVEIPPLAKSIVRLSKNKKKKNRKKSKKAAASTTTSSANSEPIPATIESQVQNGEKATIDNADVEVEYIQETLGLHELAPQYRQFFHILEAFKISETKADVPPPVLATPTALSQSKPLAPSDQFQDDGDEGDERKLEDKSKLSKRKLKKMTRLSVAELKQLVHRPDVVEMHDVTARDPKLLVQLKAHRNTVQVPRHWCFKRKYLQGKRGIEKPPFHLPEFIRRTGIMEMRASLQDKDESKTLKAKMRERARPKLGKIDIDYQKLHDAFFKWQTKPRMTIHGDLYYEGKEFETRLKEKKPGDLSEELRTALGMPVGPNANKVPPPWLIAMQRYGPPPSYPNLKVPGLNAPIPDGCSFGYHAGGWGKPPVDENGKPLYGDVFGTAITNVDDLAEDPSVERTMWGELESESEEESEEEEEAGDGDENGADGLEADESGLVTPAEGLVTPSGMASIPAGMETPETIELRKRKIEAEMEGSETPTLYQVIPEKRNDRIGNSMMGSNHVYDMTGVGAPPPAVLASRRAAALSGIPPGSVGIPIQPATGGGGGGTEREGAIELALDPSELDMDSDAMAVRYEQQIRENQSQLQKEDLSDMLAEHVAKQKSKRKRQQNPEAKQTKKYKEFKF